MPLEALTHADLRRWLAYAFFSKPDEEDNDNAPTRPLLDIMVGHDTFGD